MSNDVIRNLVEPSVKEILAEYDDFDTEGGDAAPPEEEIEAIATQSTYTVLNEVGVLDSDGNLDLSDHLPEQPAEPAEPTEPAEPAYDPEEIAALTSELETVLDRSERALDTLERRSGLGETRAVGPAEPSVDDAYHTYPLWGIHFQANEPAYLGSTQIDGLAPGTFHVVLYRYEAGEIIERVDDVEVAAHGRGDDETVATQEIVLDMDVEPGEYLLTRPCPYPREEADGDRAELPDVAFYPDDEAVSLRRRADYPDWEADSSDIFRLIGGANPAFESNEYWYYFYDLEVTTNTENGGS